MEVKTSVTIIVTFADLVEFLEERKSFKSFMQLVDKEFITRFDVKDPIEWIKAAFVWSKSEEGHSYWSHLNHEWESKLNRLNNGGEARRVYKYKKEL